MSTLCKDLCKEIRKAIFLYEEVFRVTLSVSEAMIADTKVTPELFELADHPISPLRVIIVQFRGCTVALWPEAKQEYPARKHPATFLL